MFAMSLALMGARLLSFLSCRAYGKFGITAVMRRADAVLPVVLLLISLLTLGFVLVKSSHRSYRRVS